MSRGPWYVRDMRASYMASLGWVGPSIDSILIVDKTANEIVESAGENCVVARIGFENRQEALADSHLADARLIAAAPDAFELAVDFIQWVDRFTGTLPEAQCEAMFDLYGRARQIYSTVDKEGHDAAREALTKAEQSA